MWFFYVFSEFIVVMLNLIVIYLSAPSKSGNNILFLSRALSNLVFKHYDKWLFFVLANVLSLLE